MQVSPNAYVAQLACVVLWSPSLRFAVSQSWTEFHAQAFLEGAGTTVLQALCAKAPPLPVEPYETHGLRWRQKEMLAEMLRPMPSRYPLLC